MEKNKLTERDICTKYILPAVKKAGWDIHTQVREEVSITAGRVIVRGQMGVRSKGKRADFVLYHKPNIPLAVIEAKKNSLPIAAGELGAAHYALLEVPEDEEDYKALKQRMTSCNIKPIWYPNGEHQNVGELLKLLNV